MNIFFLSNDSTWCAQCHCDSHVRKMIIETAQLLSTAWHLTLPDFAMGMSIYKPTHVNHPSAKWARASSMNYEWLATLGMALCKEYTFRWGRKHATEQVMERLQTVPSVPQTSFTAPPLAMPDMYKCDDPILSYRMYYKFGKAHLLQYTKRLPPSWLEELTYEIPFAETPVKSLV